MCNKSQVSSPFKNGKASLQPSIPVFPGTFPTTCYRQIQNNHRKRKEKAPQFSVSGIHDGNAASKGAADNINTENLHNGTSHPRTKHRPAAISLVCFLKVK